MQNIPRWKKSDRGSSHFRHGLFVISLKFRFEGIETNICDEDHLITAVHITGTRS